VPILLGEFLLAAQFPESERLFGVVVVVVVVSVLVQGSLIPFAARILRLPMETVEPEPWALGVRLRDEPGGVHRLHVEPGSAADGRTIDQLADEVGDVWVSIVVRESALLRISADTTLRAGDDVVVLADADLHDDLESAFGTTHPDT
jgi:cell volume regulation protein A